MCVCVYMLAIAGQTAKTNWLNILEGTHGYPDGVNIGKNIYIFFL